MLQHSNLDRRDSVIVSKAPFTYESTMQLDGQQVPLGGFLSLKVYVEEAYKVPYRLHSITQDGKVWFCDATGKKTLYWQVYDSTEEANMDMPFVSSVLVNKYGVLAGHIACSYEIVSLIRNVIASNEATVYLPATAFVLIPQCHVAMLSGSARSFAFINQGHDPVYITEDISIEVGSDQVILCDTGYEDSFQINLTNKDITVEKAALANGICQLQIEGSTVTYPCETRCLIIKAAPLSDLRVLRDGESIVLRGVLNA